jgi:hypothetical protein
MAAPAFVNVGATGGVGFGTGFSNMGMPASRVNGNILIGIATASNGTARTMAVSGGGGGWAVLGTPDVSANGSSLVFWRIVDGTESTPTISWTGNDNGDGLIFQISGDYSADPLGHIHQSALTSANVTMTDSGITLQRNDSLVLGIVVGGPSSSITVSSAPGGSWSTAADNNTGLGKLVAYYNSSVATAGSASPAFSVTFNTSAKWMAYTVEIGSVAPVTEYDITASPALGISQATTISTEVNIAASASLGLSEACSFGNEQDLTAAPALGVSEAAAVQLERDLSAAPSIGVSMAAQVRAANPSAQPVVCITT